MKEDQIVFKMLFKDRIFSLDEVKKMVEKNNDIAWVVYQTKRGTHRGERDNIGVVNSCTLLEKYG